MNPKVSVIIPVYNTEKYLEKCLQSLVEQTLQEIEIVVIDDGSTDRSPEIIQHYSAQYPNKFLCLRKENGGQGAARNMGLNHCTGEYIGFLDSDDYVRPEMFETMYSIAKENESDYVECAYCEFLEKEGKQIIVRPYVSSPKATTSHDLFFGPWVSPWLHLYRANMLLTSGVKFPEGMIYEDTAFYVNAVPYINRISFVGKAFVMHRKHQGSTMALHQEDRVVQILPVINEIERWYKEKNLNKEYGKEKEYFCVRILLGSSMERISRVKSRFARKRLCKETFLFIEENYPNYRKNPYMKGSLKNVILKHIAPWNVRMYLAMLWIKGRLGKQYI